MTEAKVVVDCPVQNRGYRAGVFKACPHCGGTKRHDGLVAPKPARVPKKPKNK